MTTRLKVENLEGTIFTCISCVDFICIFALFLFQWLKLTADDVKEQIYKLAKKGLTPSQIGQYNISYVIFMQEIKGRV